MPLIIPDEEYKVAADRRPKRKVPAEIHEQTQSCTGLEIHKEQGENFKYKFIDEYLQNALRGDHKIQLEIELTGVEPQTVTAINEAILSSLLKILKEDETRRI